MITKNTTKTPSTLTPGASKQNREHSPKKYKPVSYEEEPFTEKPDSCAETRIDAHSLFSMFTANMIKEKIKWFR